MTARAGASAAQRGRLTIVLPLVEAVLAREERTVEVTCIRPGLSKNGNYYAPQLLGAIVPLFEGARAFADHHAKGDRPERSVRDLVGFYTAPRQTNGGEVRAKLHVSKRAENLRESEPTVTTSDFSYLLGRATNKRLRKGYRT